jgi:hypothetical protein
MQSNIIDGIKRKIRLIWGSRTERFCMFDTDLLRSFVAVAENGGFTRAAKVLNSTQSTVSAQIQRLESDAGRPLFVRSTRSV